MNRINMITIPEQVTNVIKSYINDFEGSELRQKMALGEDYYRSKNTEIMKRRMLIYAETDEGVPYEIDDPYKSNNKLPSGYFKILVDQKTNYVLGNDITFEASDPDAIKETLGRRFQYYLKKVGKEASKKMIGWMHPYIDGDGTFKMTVVPSEQVIPIYTAHNKRQLEMVIRFYSVIALNDKNEATKVTRVEVWDDEQVTYYQENTRTGLYDLLNQDRMTELFGRVYQNPKYHFQKDLKHGEKITTTEGLAWNKVPFIPLYNNDEEEYDLQPIKQYIDAYDIINSDFVNNLEDFQDIYWILKGYGGENVSEFLHQVKRYKTLKVAEDGDARAENIEVPYLARKEAKEGLEKDIFTFGMGFNPNQLGDGNITNVVIRSRFANLDLKADQFEAEVKEFLYTLIEFVNRYRKINNEPPVELEKITFDRSLIMNEIELLDANTKQIGGISDRKRLSNHPWVTDVEEELKEIEKERENDVNLDIPIDDDSEDEDNATE